MNFFGPPRPERVLLRRQTLYTCTKHVDLRTNRLLSRRPAVSRSLWCTKSTARNGANSGSKQKQLWSAKFSVRRDLRTFLLWEKTIWKKQACHDYNDEILVKWAFHGNHTRDIHATYTHTTHAMPMPHTHTVHTPRKHTTEHPEHTTHTVHAPRTRRANTHTSQNIQNTQNTQQQTHYTTTQQTHTQSHTQTDRLHTRKLNTLFSLCIWESSKRLLFCFTLDL